MFLRNYEITVPVSFGVLQVPNKPNKYYKLKSVNIGAKIFVFELNDSESFMTYF